LQGSTPIWRRLTDPTIPAPRDVVRDASGNPVSRHTYDTLVYLPGQNKMVAFGAPGYYQTGFAFNNSDVFDFSTNTWASADAGFPAVAGVGTISFLTGYDPSSGVAWGVGPGNSNKLIAYNATSGAWTGYNKDNPNGPTSGKGAVGRGFFVFMKSGIVYAQNLATPTSAIFTPTVTGAGPSASGIESQTLEWDEAGGHFFTVASSGTVFRLTPGALPLSESWVWSSVAATGTAPGAASPNGVYGRLRSFQGDANVPRGIVYMPSASSPISFFRA